MKKFLSILLALAVGFTFTFGSAMSAFADTATPDEVKYYKAAGEYMATEASKNFDAAYSAITDAAPTDNYITAAAWETVKADLKALVLADIEAATETAITTDSAHGNLTGYAAADYATVFANKYFINYTDLLSWLTSDTETDKVGALVTNADNAVNAKVYAAQAQFKTNFDKYVAKYDKVDLTLYSKTTPTTGDTYYMQAVKKIAKDKELLNAYYFNADGTVNLSNKADIIWSDNFVKNFILGKTTTDSEKLAGFTGLTELFWDSANTITKDQFAVTGVKTIKGEATDESKDAATTAALKAQVAKNMAEYLATANAKKNLADDYATLYNCLAENIPNNSTLNGQIYTNTDTIISGINAGIPQITKAVKDVTELKAFAEKYAAEKDAAGNLVRDAKDVQAIVDRAELEIYAAAVGITLDTAVEYGNVTTAEAAIKALSTAGDAAKLAFDKEAKKAALNDAYKTVVDSEKYYELELAKVKAAYDAAIAKVDAATKADWTEIDYDLTKEIDKISKKVAVEGLFNTGAMKTELEKQVAALNALVNYKNSALKAYDDNRVVLADATTTLRDYYISNNARTVDEMKALTGVVDAVAATLPTIGSLDTAKKAAEAAIKALPAKIAATDKDAVKNAYDLAEAYVEMAATAYTGRSDVANRAALNTAIGDLRTAMNYEISKAYAQADKKDKAALKDIAKMVEDANDALVALGAEGNIEDPTTSNLSKIKNTEKEAVINAIKNLPLNITEADRAKVEAARALYDAYVADWTDVNDADTGYVAAEITNFSDLSLAEAALAIIDDAAKLDDKAAKAYVQDLAIAVRTAKSGKKVKVTVNADVQTLIDNGFTVEYKFYKSTKKSSGYKNTVNKTTNTYTNTNPVKGKNYYKVKLVVKNADGTVVATTPLTQCKYGVRTMK